MSQAYEKVLKARDLKRISTIDIIEGLTDWFVELHGDRYMEDDKSIIGGIGMYDNQPVTIIGIQKGLTTRENIERNFGSVGPGGYRKAIRLVEQANKFNRPVLTLINTAGAHASPESEETGIGEAIAESLLTFAKAEVPTLSIILGEGGSGGALGLALTDEVWMFENSVYSILSPEGFASILWKDAKLAPKAAELMKLTAEDLLDLKVVEKIIPEMNHGVPLNKEIIIKRTVNDIKEKFKELSQVDVHTRQAKRDKRFRSF
ncbi:acetyl-CoA carboxylase carboxyl transferase subunit alpha [Aerococcaceae bacterium DSM 111021]|nr:acetyl-CoA carboxylase carboxyl transferase subunit alpha [Aerococcaceae bacterium DSM 111021]